MTKNVYRVFMYSTLYSCPILMKTEFSRQIFENPLNIYSCPILMKIEFSRQIFENPLTIYSCPILIKIEFSRQIFENPLNIKFHENPSSGSRGVSCGRTDMPKLIVAFRNFSNAIKNQQSTLLTTSHPSLSLIRLVHISAQFGHYHSSFR
jgi:hypothetical protein